MKVPKVYIVNKGGHDMSDAERFGKFVYITKGKINKLAINEMYRDVVDSLKDSKPDDFILITSLTSLCVITCSCFSYKYGKLNLLLFNDGKYVQRHIQIDSLIELMEGSKDDTN